MNTSALKDSEAFPQLSLTQLAKWLQNAPENSRRVTIVPEVAASILQDLNKNNRPKKPEEIRRYASDIKEGRWVVTGDSVKFGTDGYLKDGQNRLSACVQAGEPFQTHVVFGIQPSVFAHIDRGKNRNPADVFHIAGIQYPGDTAAAVRWILLIANDDAKARTTFQPNHLLEEYRKLDAKALELCVKTCRKIKTLTKQPVGPLASVYYLCRQKAAGKADQLFKEWASGSPSPVIIKLQKKLIQMASQNNGRIHDVVRVALIVQAWNHFIKGQKGALTKLDWTLNKPFPKIEA